MSFMDGAGPGVRARGLGEAFVAVADDASAIHHNPAGLSRANFVEITSQYGRPLSGLDDESTVEDQFFGGRIPLKGGRWGAVGLAYHATSGASFFQDRVISVGYGKKLRPGAFGWNGQWSWGATVKQFHREYQPDLYTANALNEIGTATGEPDPLFTRHGYSKDVYAVDVGGLYQFGAAGRQWIGFSLANINQPDSALGEDGDKIPFVARGGFATEMEGSVLSLELRRAKRLASSSDTEGAIGAERRFRLLPSGSLAIRGGYAQGSRGFEILALGASIGFGPAELHYGFDFPIDAELDVGGNHQIALAVRWPSPK